jgi:hypothetical protein
MYKSSHHTPDFLRQAIRKNTYFVSRPFIFRCLAAMSSDSNPQADLRHPQWWTFVIFLVSDNSRSELYQQVSRSRREIAGFVRAVIWSRVRDPARADQVIST